MTKCRAAFAAESADIEDDQNKSSDEDESVVRLGNLDW